MAVYYPYNLTLVFYSCIIGWIKDKMLIRRISNIFATKILAPAFYDCN